MHSDKRAFAKLYVMFVNIGNKINVLLMNR